MICVIILLVKLLMILLQLLNFMVNLVLKLDINPYGDMSYEQLEEFYIKHGFIKKEDRDYVFYIFNEKGKNESGINEHCK